MSKEKNLQSLFTLMTSRNKNTKKLEKKPKLSVSRSNRSPKGEPMSNPLSYSEKISYNY